jgi:hypothetical protein
LLALPVQRLKRAGEAATSLGICGIDSYGPFVADDRFFKAFQPLQGGGKPVVGFRKIGIVQRRTNGIREITRSVTAGKLYTHKASINRRKIFPEISQ